MVGGDGLFDLLPVSFAVDTLRAGFYTWTGDLRAPDGTVLGVASGRGFLSAGVTSVGFTFQGQPIGASGLDGPYTVGNAAVYGPFGAAAPSPRFVIPSVILKSARPMGSGHLRLSLGDTGGKGLEAVLFGAFDTDLGPALGDAAGSRFHIAGRIEANHWNGRTRVQLRVEDAARCDP